MDDPFADEVANEPAPPPKKKSLFKKPTWKKTVDVDNDSVNFFSRAKELFPIQAAEEERRRQKKLVKLERKRSTASAERRLSTTPESKRRRISSQADGPEHSSESSHLYDGSDDAARTQRASSQSTPGSRKSSASQKESQASPTSLSARYSRDLENRKKDPAQGSGAVITLTDSEDEAKDQAPGRKNPPRQAVILDDDEDDLFSTSKSLAVPIEDDPESEEEFPELVQRAREKKLALERLKASSLFGEKNHASHGSSALINPIDDVFEELNILITDPVIEILISSPCLEGTKPMIVKRKLSQPIKQVRLTWVDKQVASGAIAAAMKPDIILTWKGKVLYDVATCANLGLKAGVDGKVSSEHLDEHGRIHFEAWTNELHMAEQQKQAARLEHGDEEEPEPEPEPVVEKIKLIMKARDLEPYKLVVKPTTLIEKMIAAFSEARQVLEGKEITIHFDGEILDPSSTVADADLGDMDTVEVYFR